MRVFTHNKFEGHWPVGTAAVVVAENRATAKFRLEWALKEVGLTQTIDMADFDELDLQTESAAILNDGNY